MQQQLRLAEPERLARIADAGPLDHHGQTLRLRQRHPAAKIPVEISTPKNTASPRPGTPFETKDTGKKGLVKFKDLKPSKIYCWVAIIAPSFKSSECAGWQIWQGSTINLGT